MKTRVILRAPSEKPNNIKYQPSSERKSRCSSPTSNVSSGWDGSDCEVHAAQMTNSSSPPPPRTSENWPRSFLHRRKRAKPDQKGACATFNAPLSAPATRCFSTESAGSGPSPRVQKSRVKIESGHSGPTILYPKRLSIRSILHNQTRKHLRYGMKKARNQEVLAHARLASTVMIYSAAYRSGPLESPLFQSGKPNAFLRSVAHFMIVRSKVSAIRDTQMPNTKFLPRSVPASVRCNS